jgi:hypothetical protein
MWERQRVMRVSPGAMRLGLAIGAGLVALSCSLGSPTPPEPVPERDPSPVTQGTLPPAVPAAPAATPAPTPKPGDPSPSPSPSPTPDTSGCGAPLPPPVSRISVKVHARGADAWTLDSTPLVRGAAYCQEIGFTDGRSECPVRPEGNPERPACELYVMGRAKDTNRPGPTWYFKGGFCTGQASGCQNHPENQYQLRIFVGGKFSACSRSGICGEVEADR